MNSNVLAPRLRDYLPPVRRLGLFVAAVAVAAMSIVAVAANVSEGGANGCGTRPVIVANDRNNPVTTPAIPKRRGTGHSAGVARRRLAGWGTVPRWRLARTVSRSRRVDI